VNLAILVGGLILSLVVAGRSAVTVRRGALVALLGLALGAPLLTPNPLTLAAVAIAGAAAVGWNIIGGFTGYAAFGQAAFFGLGGYTMAVLVARSTGSYGLPAGLALPLAGLVPALIAALIGLVVLRLRGHYFAIATLGVGIAVRELVNNVDCVGLPSLSRPLFCLGAAGGIILPPLRRSEVAATNLTFYFAALGLLAGGTLALALLHRSKFGYGLRAIRANEEAAAVMGIQTTRFKVLAFATGAALTGLAGGLQVLINGSVLPDQSSIFDPYRSLEVILICLIGGVGTVWGPLIGALVLYAVQEALTGLLGSGDWRPVFFGAFVILLILFLPRGLQQFTTGGGRPTWRILWRNLTANRV